MEQSARQRTAIGTEALLCTADEGLAAAVAAAAAAVQQPVVRTREVESLIGLWRDAGVVIVGADLDRKSVV